MNDSGIHVVIVAGGSGRRMKSEIPKQFLMLGDAPLIIQSIRVFLEAFPASPVTIAIHPAWEKEMEAIRQDYLSEEKITLTEGGTTRFESVRNALATLPDDDLPVLIHDAVRPLLSPSLIKRVAEAVEEGRGVIPAIAVKDSLRRVEGEESYPIDRQSVVRVQTPQGFPLAALKEAYTQAYREAFTDDASVFEQAGGKIKIIEGEEKNIKITAPSDLDWARLWYRNTAQ